MHHFNYILIKIFIFIQNLIIVLKSFVNHQIINLKSNIYIPHNVYDQFITFYLAQSKIDGISYNS